MNRQMGSGAATRAVRRDWARAKRRRLARRVMAASLALAVAAGVGLALAPAAPSAAADVSAVTVAWAGGNPAEVQQYQPVRDPASPHHPEFKDLQVTVSKTADLVDEAVTVTVSGMPGPSLRLTDSYGVPKIMGANFVQAMQCWGDPAAADFHKNCLYGAFATTKLTAAPPVNIDVIARHGGSYEKDVPFRAVTGAEYSSIRSGLLGEDTAIFQVFGPQTTNERFELVDQTKTARFLFDVQSAASQPYLGCGDQASATGSRCWLVIVPRGAKLSSVDRGCSMVPNSGMEGIGLQKGSPIDPDCDYWSNRVVVPLDFRPTGPACPAGSVERLVVGAEAAAAAFGSWQAGICRSGGSAYALTTAADTAVRGQLLAGQTGMAVTARPLAKEWLVEGADLDQLAAAQIVYAPLAVSAGAVAFLHNNQGAKEAEVRLTPRLIAKLMTHSYPKDQPLCYYSSSLMEGTGWEGCVATGALGDDPEFRALNPTGFQSFQGSLIMTGPNASDAIAQLWSYLQADEAAAAFLSGEPDNVRPGDEANKGYSLNPYYLPKGHPRAKVPELYEGTAYDSGSRTDNDQTLLPLRDAAGQVKWREVGLAYGDGSPMCLCDAPVDTFLKADETPLPQMLNAGGAGGQQRYDVLQLRPYAASLEASARQLFRADIGSKTEWDATKWNGSGNGAWISNGQ
ncbi:MAG: hypothetical protein LBO20_10400, partial [Bifidobacteriaceae bacterium]|nr:hypothetical protein [Bifidobacteriaceae bacterium]